MFYTVVGFISFSIALIIYILLLCGLPLGEFAMGGKHKVLPKNIRIMVLLSIPIQVFAMIILLQTGRILPLYFSERVTRNICIGSGIFLSLNSLANLFSHSNKERYFSGTLSIVTSVCFWLTALL